MPGGQWGLGTGCRLGAVGRLALCEPLGLDHRAPSRLRERPTVRTVGEVGVSQLAVSLLVKTAFTGGREPNRHAKFVVGAKLEPLSCTVV